MKLISWNFKIQNKYKLFFAALVVIGTLLMNNDKALTQTHEQLLEAATKFPTMPRGAAGMIPFVDSISDLTFASSTPYNDLEYSLFDTDFIEGETTGYDVFCPVDPADDIPGANTVKYVLCVSNIMTDNIYGAAKGDRVILGLPETDFPFFTVGSDSVDNDYAVIHHFDYEYGHIQLNGIISDYQLIYGTVEDGCATEGWYLFYTKDEQIDLIAFIFPCWDVEIITASQDTFLMCNSDNMLDLNNINQFKFTSPISPDPIIDTGIVQFGSKGKEIVHGVILDNEDYIYVYGTGDGNLDYFDDPDQEMFVAKFDNQGDQIWVTEFGNKNGDLIFDAVVDDTFLYAAGRTLGNLPGFRNQGSWDAIVVKIALENGEIVAMNQWGAGGIDGYGNITLDDAGNLYMSGAGSPPEGPSSGDNCYLVAKHNAATLENIWRAIDPVLPNADKVTEAWGGISYIPGDEPGKGKLVIGGWFRPPGNPPKGADGFVSLYGNLDQDAPTVLAVQQISSPGFKADWVLDNIVDSDGNIYAAGYTTGNLQSGQRGEGDMFVVKFDSALANPKYAQWGTVKSDMFRKLEIDNDNNLYAIGYTYGHYGMPGYQGTNKDSTALTGDVITQKFDVNLNRLKALQFGTQHEERGFAYVKDSLLYVAGMTEGSLVNTHIGSFDGYLLTLNTTDLSMAGNQTSGTDPEFIQSRPYQFELFQNYPNPFNPTTQITFHLPVSEWIDLSIYNVLGQKVETLVHREMEAGRHHVSFSGNNMASGHYFFILKSQNHMRIQKGVLIK